MRLIYIAGPFRAPTLFDMTQNVARAEFWGLQAAKLGHMPLIPHANTWKMYGAAPEELFLKGTQLLLTKCDGAIFIPGWKKSSGSVGEMELCEAMKIPWLSLDPLGEVQGTVKLMVWLKDNFE